MTDAFVHDDAAYVLGALSAEERTAFEAHLRTCAECAARVREIQDLPPLLADISAEEIGDAAHTLPDTLPDTLLPGLLRRAAVQRRRRRWLVGGLATVAAACVIALVVTLWPTSPTTAPARTQQFVALVPSPVVAFASLTPKPWGTEIDVDCKYAQHSVTEQRIPYAMYVYDRSGAKERVGSWWQPDHDIKYETGTALSPAQIAKIEITLPNGTPILRLTT